VYLKKNKYLLQNLPSLPALQSPKGEQKQEVASAQVEKPLSFAEKLALKKAQSTQTIQPVSAAPLSVEKPATIPVLADTTITTGQNTSAPIQATEIAAIKETISDTANPQIEQAYSDIKDKINLLELASDTELPEQMKTLKKSLMENPAAVSLMLDTDIGKMVIALRRITKEALVEASKEKTKGNGKKDKSMPVDADAIAKVFDEL
jgi:hypothetical protein